jgi:hypothetical protein
MTPDREPFARGPAPENLRLASDPSPERVGQILRDPVAACYAREHRPGIFLRNTLPELATISNTQVTAKIINLGDVLYSVLLYHNPTKIPRRRRKKMRRLVMTLGLVMLFVFAAAGVAVAVNKDCNSIPCNGTDNEDVLHEREGTVKDRMFGFGAHDVLDANNYFSDRDVLHGGAQGDKLLANDRDGRDALRGGAGRDRCFGDPGDRFVNCEVRSTNAAAGVDVE